MLEMFQLLICKICQNIYNYNKAFENIIINSFLFKVDKFI